MRPSTRLPTPSSSRLWAARSPSGSAGPGGADHISPSATLAPAFRPTRSRACCPLSAATSWRIRMRKKDGSRAADRQGTGRVARRRIPPQLDAAQRHRSDRHLSARMGDGHPAALDPEPIPEAPSATAPPPARERGLRRGLVTGLSVPSRRS